MITYEQKLAHMTDIIFKEFSELLEPLGSYIFLRLFWLEAKKLRVRGTLEEIRNMLEVQGILTDAQMLDMLRTIKECGLINAKKSDDGMILIGINTVSKPDLAQKIAILETLAAKSLISAGTYGSIKEELTAKKKIPEANSELESKTIKPSNDVDFNKPKPSRKVNPDSAPELVKFYYRLMHEVFGGKYESPNLLKEAHQLKLEMEKHGDSADDTRKFFAFILNGAKEKEAFDKVSSLSLYSRLRPTAYQKIVVEKNAKYDKFMKYEEVKKSDVDIMTSMKEIYVMCMKGGMPLESTRTELENAFTPELVEEFFKGLTDGQDRAARI